MDTPKDNTNPIANSWQRSWPKCVAEVYRLLGAASDLIWEWSLIDRSMLLLLSRRQAPWGAPAGGTPSLRRCASSWRGSLAWQVLQITCQGYACRRILDTLNRLRWLKGCSKPFKTVLPTERGFLYRIQNLHSSLVLRKLLPLFCDDRLVGFMLHRAYNGSNYYDSDVYCYWHNSIVQRRLREPHYTVMYYSNGSADSPAPSLMVVLSKPGTLSLPTSEVTDSEFGHVEGRRRRRRKRRTRWVSCSDSHWFRIR